MPIEGQPQDIEMQIRQLVMEFIKNPNCIILGLRAWPKCDSKIVELVECRTKYQSCIVCNNMNDCLMSREIGSDKMSHGIGDD